MMCASERDCKLVCVNVDTVELIDIHNKPIQACVFRIGHPTLTERMMMCVGVCTCMHCMYSTVYSCVGGSIVQSSECSGSQCSHVDKDTGLFLRSTVGSN